MRAILEDLHSFSVDHKNREIFVHRYHNNTDDSDVENKMSSMFIKNIRTLDQKPGSILIHLNAGGGGEWEEGMAMYDAITFAESYVTVLIYGCAYSMSSIIPQAADLRIMMPNSYMMCHYGSENFVDNHTNNLKYFNLSVGLSHKMVDIYANKIKKSPFVTKDKRIKDPDRFAEKFIKRKLEEGDWYLTSEEAVYYGLVDDILGSERFPNIRSIKNG